MTIDGKSYPKQSLVVGFSRLETFVTCRWPGLQSGEAATAVGASAFAYFAKGGYDDGISNGQRRTDKSCACGIAAHPCKERKDGATSVGMVQGKAGSPALFPV